MPESMRLQGRNIYDKDIIQIKDIISTHPQWGRTRISRELCGLWDWRNEKGILKDIACRSLLRKLEQKKYITLPPRRSNPVSRMRDQKNIFLPLPFYSISSQAKNLKEARPLKIEIVKPKTADGKLFNNLLAEHHYLGYKGSVGEHLDYLIRDNKENILGCLLFGAAAWRTASRDKFIGWNDEQRWRQLHLIANNMRFLLLNRIPHLASCVLGEIARRISKDWEEKYGHPIIMLETFVEIGRFAGTCYRAANWIQVGQTRGRSRNDIRHSFEVPVKSIYLYPLIKNFKEKLCI